MWVCMVRLTHNPTEKEDKVETTVVKMNGQTVSITGAPADIITVMRALVNSDEVVTLTVESI